MRKSFVSASMAVLLFVTAAGTALATPSTQIWIPSTDIQPFMTGHLGIDSYFRSSGKLHAPPNAGATRDANTLDIGLTAGILPFEKFQMEVGFDYLTIANDPNDHHPWSGNAKVGTPEDSLFKYSPALAVGIYNARPIKEITTRDAPSVTSGQNIVYGLVAKTLPALGPIPSLGRFTAGYYRGAERALVDENGNAANDGVLLSWDRTMNELSDRLWVGVDYMGGRNVDSSVNFGVSWAFAKNVSVLFGYDIYTVKKVAGGNTFTAQVDINFP